MTECGTRNTATTFGMTMVDSRTSTPYGHMERTVCGTFCVVIATVATKADARRFCGILFGGVDDIEHEARPDWMIVLPCIIICWFMQPFP